MLKIILIFALCISLNANKINYVKMCVDPNWMPMESIDKNGNYIGIVADILALIETKTNLKFTLVPTQSWKQSLIFMKDRKCDVLPLASQTEDRKEWLNFTPVYMDYPEVIVTLSTQENKSLKEVLKLPIGITKGYVSIDQYRENYPGINIVEVEDIDDAFEKLRSKEIYSYSDTLPIIGYKLQKEGILDLKISHKMDKVYSLEASMAISKDRIKLHQDLTDVINRLGKDSIDDITSKWIKINIKDLFNDYVLIYKISGVVLFFILLTLIVLYWNYKLKSLVKKQTTKIEEFANTLQDEVKQKTKKIKNLLDNAGQGFLTLDTNFLIDNEYSKECEDLLGKDIAKKDITKIFYNDGKKLNRLKKDFSITLGIENKSTQLSAISLLPKEIVVREKTLQIEYKIIDNYFMLILTNISENKKLESKIHNEQEILKMIVAITKDNDMFFDIKNDFEYFSKNIDENIDKNKTPLDNIKDIYRIIHTFKGSFLQLYMNETVSNLHDLESKLSNMIEENTITTNDKLSAFLKDISFDSFDSLDLDSINTILGNSFFDRSKFILAKKKSLKIIEEDCTSLLGEYNESKVISILENIRTLSQKSLKSYLVHYVTLALQLSNIINKPIYDFEVTGNNSFILPDKFISFVQSLGHIFRNSIEHGIENGDIRYRLGKDMVGTISCSFEVKENLLEIKISDDGSGVNIEKIKTKLGDVNLNTKEAISQIFKDGFSTKDTASNIAGRGRGLSAVKYELDKIDGNVEVQSETNIGTTFVFILSMSEI